MFNYSNSKQVQVKKNVFYIIEMNKESFDQIFMFLGFFWFIFSKYFL